MPNVVLKFSLSDTAVAMIDALRDTMSRDDFLRHALTLGLGEIVEASTRTSRDYITHAINGQTKDYRQGRAVLFRADEPDGSPKVAAELVGRPFSTTGRGEAT